MNYTTADRLSAYMKITTPTGVQLTAMNALITAITKFINQYTNRTFDKTTYTRFEVDTERGQTLVLPQFPVVTTDPFILERRNSQINEDHWEVIDGLYYTLDSNAGIIQMMDGVYLFRGRRLYRVTYSAGFSFDNVSTFLGDTDAADIEVAVWLIAQDAWKNQGVPSNLYQEKIGDYSITYQRPVKGTTGYMFDNAQAIAILDQYQTINNPGLLTPLQSI